MDSARDASVLVGRDDACRRIDAVLATAREGRRAALVVRGEAGMGKTSLLDAARDRARGLRLLEVEPVEAESSIAFAGLVQLLHPIRKELRLADSRHGTFLSSLLDGSLTGDSGRFSVGTALLQVLAMMAGNQPVLLLLDDVHWMDADSRDALMFAVRRMREDAIAVIAATRLPSEDDAGTAGLPDMELSGLSRPDLGAVLSRRVGGVIDPALVARVWEETGGNPLAALEILRGLNSEQRAGVVALPPVLASRTSAELFAAHVQSLSAPAARLLCLLSMAAADTAEVARRAARDLGLDLGAGDELHAGGLVRFSGGRVVLGHPLVHAAATAAFPPSTLRDFHQALADAIGADPDMRARRVWHLAAAADGPSDPAAQAMAAVGYEQRSSGGFAAASAAYEQAAELARSTQLRADYLVAAADCARLCADRERARALAVRSRPWCTSASQRAFLDGLGGLMELFAGPPEPAAHALLNSAREAENDAPAEACLLYAYAAIAQFLAGQGMNALMTATQAASLAKSRGIPAPPAVQMILGTANLRLGNVSEGLALLTMAAGTIQSVHDQPIEHHMMATLAFIWIGDHHTARRILVPHTAGLRSADALGNLPFALSLLAYAHLRAGKLASAYADAAEAAELARDTRDVIWHHSALGTLALVESYQGREAACRRHALAARRVHREMDISYPRDELDALGLLELGSGRPTEALHYLRQANRANNVDSDQVVFGRLTGPDLVEACIRSGQPVPPDFLAAVNEQADETGFLYSTAQAARCLGLLTHVDKGEKHFHRAIELYGELDLPLDVARTELALGERLRRAGRRADARQHLRRAVDLFDETGADLWAHRARAEAQATGQDIPVRPASSLESLTPQEHRVALTVGQGATNREAASALFLSEKTIETHLSRVYRKLSIRSRAELVRALTGASVADVTPPNP
ncbi:AAA family ATPase [Actinoplanes sp. GCM10030250]|uniref:AAA family ATPase n=1 Tax=Actinoplanes sp. GCM10030250 TaxID=3273376 RepID=UPI00360CC6DF